MARDSSGTKNQPQYATTGAPADAADMSEIANYAAAIGNRVTGTSAQRTGNLLPFGAGTLAYTPWEGLEWDETDTGMVYRYTSGAWLMKSNLWTTYTPTVVGIVVGTGGTTVAQWRREGDLVRVRYCFTLGSSGASVASNPTVTLPVNAVALNHPYMNYNGSGSIYDTSLAIPYVTFVGADNTAVGTFRIYTPGTNGTYTALSATSPIAPGWATGDVIQGEFDYRSV
jgi:hypothetical protein